MKFLREFKPSHDGEIILMFTDVGKQGSWCDFCTFKICLLTVFAKIKLSRTFLNLQLFNVLKKWDTTWISCLVVYPISVYSYGVLFNCMTVGQGSDSMTNLL